VGKFDKYFHLSNFIAQKLIIGLIIRYVSLNIIEKIIPKPNIFIETRTQDSFRICDPSSCNIVDETNNFVLCAVLLSFLVSELQKPTSPRIEPRTFCRGCGPHFCNLLFETNSFGLDAVLLSCLVSELQKPSSSGIELKTVFWVCGLCFCNLLFETNSFGLGAVLLSCLVSELQERPSPGIELSTLSGVLTLLCSLAGLKEYACQIWCKSIYPFS
jgi:hypothetical protein